MNSEVGRELNVSDLRRETVIVLEKPGRPMATMWVREIGARYVMFASNVDAEGTPRAMIFFAKRDGEGIHDDDGPMKMYEYLGAV
jgi:hypothetical protein